MAEVDAASGKAPSGARNGVAASRAATLAALEAGKVDAEPVDAPPGETTPAPEAASTDVAPAEPKPDEAKPAAEAKAEDKPDAETEKRLAKVHAAEKRAKEALATERKTFADEKAQFERERHEFKGKLERFEQLAARAKYDPASVLLELGLTEDDFEPAARDIYTRSKAAKPGDREASAARMQQREAQDTVAQMKKRLDEYEQREKQREVATQVEQAWQGYFGDVAKIAQADTSDASLVRSAMTKSPERTEKAMRTLANQMCQETGEWPDAADVVARYEKTKRAELDELGIDPSIVSKAGAKAPAAKPADEKRAPAKTLNGGELNGSTTAPKPGAKGFKERRAETLSLLEAGKLDS